MAIIPYDINECVWFPKQRTLVLVDNSRESIDYVSDSTIRIAGRKRKVNFDFLDSYSNGIWDQVFENICIIEPALKTQSNLYRTWKFYNEKENIGLLLCSSFGHPWELTRSYFENRKTEIWKP